MSNNENKIKKGLRKVILLGVMIFFATQLLAPVAVMTTKYANAQWAVFETESVPAIRSSILDKLWAAIKTAADVTFKNVLKTYVNNLAYDAATKLATGDWGQKPFYPTGVELGNIGIEAADVAAGDFLDEVANDWFGGDSQCYGYDISCQNDQSCPAPLLDCSTPRSDGKISVGVMENCSHNYAAMQECIALGCRLVKQQDDTLIKQLHEQDKLDNPATDLYIAGAASCTNNFSLCDQTDQLKLSINLSARATYDPNYLDVGKCPVTSIINNFERQTSGVLPSNIWDELTNKQKSNLYLAEISKTFNPNASEIGALIQIVNKTNEKAGLAKEKEELAQKITGPINNVTSLVTGFIKTPAPLLEGALNALIPGSINVQSTYTGSLVADAIGTFTNTLSSKLLTRYFAGLSSDEVSSRSSKGLGSILSYVKTGITAAKLLFSELRQVDYSVGGNIDIITNLSSCPDPEDPTSDTCIIDARFATAIQQQLTVREAMDAGLLDASRTFGFEADGREPEYYNGYPYRSLVILRKYRIIPVGWELAAKYMQQYAPGRYSLSVLIAEYDNVDSPFYKLVDPNWVLKAPQLFCAKEGAGEKIEFEQAIRTVDTNQDDKIDIKDAAITTIARNDSYCADEQLCLVENDDGSCKKFGYCVEEEPVWKFDGSACEPQNNSCLSFDDGNSYLTNTVDYNGCSADNIGCQWYCQSWDQVAGEWQCSNQTPNAGGQKISLTDKVSSCSEADAGCTEYIPVSNSGANLAVNSSFELFNENGNPLMATDGTRDSGLSSELGGTSLPDEFDNWSHNNVDSSGNPCTQRSLASSDTFDGSTSARLHYFDLPSNDCTDGNYAAQEIETAYLTSNRTFTVSMYAKPAEGGTCTSLNNDLGVDLARSFSAVSTQFLGQQDINIALGNWTRYAFTFTWDNRLASEWNWPTEAENVSYRNKFTLFIRHVNSGCDILIDNIQVEEGGLTNYKSREDSPKSYLTKAPDYLNCTGNAGVDAQECDNFALYCSESDVGCTRYTSFMTGNVVNGKITDAGLCNPNDPYSCDQCPAAFAGCQAFREMATTKTPFRPTIDPISFVPDSGLVCPASAVGCEEYTNLEEVSLGGEGKEYYNEIRQCVLNTDSEVATYYTWEGSDEFGFQLKDYRLKVSNLGNAPCTNMAPDDPYLEALGFSWPNCLDGVDVDRDGDSVTDESYVTASCTDAELGVDPDCTEFFDTAGNSFYRLKSRVIYADANCKIYRNSIDSSASCESGTCSNTGSQCADDTVCNELLYHLLPGQGQSCQAEYAGCRAYKGNAGDNSRLVYSEDFEKGDTGDWIGIGTFLSNESVNFGGHSLFSSNDFNFTGWSIGASPKVLNKGSSYKIAFWAKAGVTTTPIKVAVNWTGATYWFSGQAVAKTGEWQRFELGPIYLDQAPPISSLIHVEVDYPIYMDNIKLTEIVDNIYRIKDSYIECSGYENCQRYDDSNGAAHYLKSFTSLCDASLIGCQAFIDTFNTSTTGIFNYDVSGPSPTVTNSIPADETVFLVNDPEKSCLASAKGCQRLGLPNINSAGTVSSFSDVFLLNNPDDYNNILCLFEESGCEDYSTPDGAQYYFKDPGVKICEYKRVTGENVSGWYKQETNSGTPDCPVTDGICEQSGIMNGTVCSNANGNISECIDPNNVLGTEVCNPNYDIVSQPTDGWVGSCPADESGCTEFRDPETTIEDSDERCNAIVVDGGGNGVDRIECDSYYYISGEVDEQSCNGLVNRDEGCRLFYDTTVPNLIYYSAFTSNGQPPVISCDPTEPLCTPDSNTIIKVRQDRTCSRWLECSTAIIQEKEDGQTQNLCSEVAICDKLDQNTNHCVSWSKYTEANQTFSLPAFAEKVSNYSGLVIAGLDWGRRCEDDPYKTCDNDLHCATGECGQPQIIEGQLPVVAMSEVGSAGINGDLISMGDFGDSIFAINDILTFWLTGGSTSPPELADPIPLQVDDIAEFNSSWSGRVINGGASQVYWTEAQANGVIPSANANIDENNVLQVKTNRAGTSAQENGAAYSLGSNVIRGQEYVVSFKLKWFSQPTLFDRIRVEFGYEKIDGTEYASQVFGPDIKPTSEWEEYILGPITAGYDDAGAQVSYTAVNLNIIHIDADGNNIQPVEYYLDDVALKPVLKTTQDGGYLTRDCRLYPRDDSKYCTYTDENNTTYQGWYGYCLEYDPQNKKNCLNWWPIDLLAGESDQLNSLPPLNYTGRRPLYMCTQSSGSQAPIITTQTSFNLSNLLPVNKLGSNYIIVPETDTRGVPVPLNDGWTTPVGSGFWMATGGDDACQPGGSLADPAECGAWMDVMNFDNIAIPAGGITEEDIDKISLVWSGTGGWAQWQGTQGYLSLEQAKLGLLCDSSSEPLACGFVGKFDRAVNGNNDIVWRVYPTVDCHGDEHDYQCVWIQIIFDGTTHQLKTIRTNGEDATVDADEPAWLHLAIQLKEACTNLAEVVTNNKVPQVWWSRVNVASTYTVPNLLYNYTKNFNPYGAVINPSLNDPSIDWPLLPVQQPTNPPNSSEAHAGSSYSCGPGGCTNRVCNWYNLNNCSNEAEVNACIAHHNNTLNIDRNDGYCIGLGSKYCSNNSNISCDRDADCGNNNTCVTTGAGAWASTASYTDAETLIKRLFANVYKTYHWTNGQYKINNLDNDWKSDFGRMPVCGYSSVAGRSVRPQYVAGSEADYCGVPPTIAVTASGYEGNAQFINLGEEGGRVQFNVTINADKDQLPITMIEVDWNSLDGNDLPDTVIQGNYGNGTLSINHIYQPSGNSATIFSPIFRVVDNWGWCSVPQVSSVACPYSSCRHELADSTGTECGWYDPDINIRAGLSI